MARMAAIYPGHSTDLLRAVRCFALPEVGPYAVATVDGVVELSNCACISINRSRRLLFAPVVPVVELELSEDEPSLEGSAVVIVTVEPSG